MSRLLRALSFALALAAVSCGGAEPALRDDGATSTLTRRGPPSPRVQLRVGMRFDIAHRWTVRVGELETLRVVSRGTMVVERMTESGGAVVRITFVRPRTASEPEAWIVARVGMRQDGRAAHDPIVLCAGDSFHLERLLRHLAMPVNVRGQTIESELLEEPVAGEVDLGRSHGRRAIRARAQTRIRSVELGSLHASGTAQLSLLAELGEDGISGRRRLRTRIEGRYRDRDDARQLDGVIEVESDARIELTTDTTATPLPSEAGECVARIDAPAARRDAVDESELPRDSRDGVLLIQSHRAEIRACYEDELRASPRLEGRVRVRFTVAPTGETLDVVVTDDGLGSEVVTSCVARIVASFRFASRPNTDPATFEFPFAFRRESRGAGLQLPGE